MLEQSKATLANASKDERAAAEVIALRLLASGLEEDLVPAAKARDMAEAHRAAEDETWQRSVLGVLLGLREAAKTGHRVA